jgi:TPR repeat protein
VDRLGRSLAGIALLAAVLAAGSSLMVLQTLKSIVPGASTTALPAAAAVAAKAPASGSGIASSVAEAASSKLEGAAGVAAATAPGTPAPTRASILYDVFSTGDVSPRGRTAKGMDMGSSLALADTYIHGDSSSTDLKEGEYWIRHAIGRVMADTRLRWALTQLGSVYAAPGGVAPDFEKARLMWEMSGALGDTVALCFLGNLYEYGLGVPADREIALRWYERALAAGGCKGLDEAIARVKR